MTKCDPFLFHELSVIDQIIRDETWLEGERRGCYVSPLDPVVTENVCQVILRIGHQLRESALRQVAQGQPAEPVAISAPPHHQAA